MNECAKWRWKDGECQTKRKNINETEKNMAENLKRIKKHSCLMNAILLFITMIYGKCLRDLLINNLNSFDIVIVDFNNICNFL